MNGLMVAGKCKLRQRGLFGHRLGYAAGAALPGRYSGSRDGIRHALLDSLAAASTAARKNRGGRAEQKAKRDEYG